QPAAANGRPGGSGGSGGSGIGGGSIGSLDDAALTELLLAALRDGNDVMLRAVDPDRLRARLVDGSEQAGDDTGLLRRLQLEGYEAQVQRFRLAVEAE